MKSLKKLALVSAMIAASSSAFAMEALDEEAMAAATGQDGLRITLDTNLSGMNIKWIDRDGTGVAGYGNAGAVTIGPVGISTTGMTIDIDAGGSVGDTTGDGLLAIGISAPNAINVNLNNTAIAVADATASGSTSGTATTVIQFDATAALTIGAGLTMDIELGNEVNDFVTINANLGTVTLTGLSIVDGSSSESIGIATMTLSGLTIVDQTINIEATGLVINTGTGLTSVGLALEGLTLGSTPSIGDVYVTGLNLSNNTITVAGK